MFIINADQSFECTIDEQGLVLRGDMELVPCIGFHPNDPAARFERRPVVYEVEEDGMSMLHSDHFQHLVDEEFEEYLEHQLDPHDTVFDGDDYYSEDF